MSVQPTAGDTLLARFRLLEELDADGATRLWLAEDRHMGERVALRVLAPELVSSESARDRMRAACRAARRLTHPGILRVYDFHVDERVCAISREYVPGTDLGGLVGQAPGEIVCAMLPVVEALEYAHEGGATHGDLKRSKIVGSAAGGWRIADFGLARSLHPPQPGDEVAAPRRDVVALGQLLRWLLPDTTTAGGDRPAAALLDVLSRMVDPSCSNPLESMRAARVALAPFAARARPATARSSPATTDTRQPAAAEPTEPAIAVPFTPVAPTARTAEATPAPAEGPVRRFARPRPGPLALLALVALAAITGGVFLYLPRWVADRHDGRAQPLPPAPAGRTSEPQAPPRAPEEVAATLREESRRLLIEVITAYDALEMRGAALWGGAEFERAGDLRRQAENALQTRAQERATPLLRDALEALHSVEQARPAALAATLERAEQALGAGDQREATRQFALAVQIDPESAAALEGAARAEHLDEVLAHMRTGSEAEQTGRLPEARDAYAEAVKVDPRWQPAADALARIDEKLAGEIYTAQMAAAVTALAEGRIVEAQTAYRKALQARPDSAEARAGLAHVEQLRRSQLIQHHRDLARRAEELEDWAVAVSNYESALALDGAAAFARAGLPRAREHLQLTKRMAYLIEHPRELYDPGVASEARDLLATAERLEAGKPRLEAQRARLKALVTEALTPVPVVLESDGRTEITVQRVGRLGTFERRELMLRPGTYVARGVRRGYRDVRRTITVVPGHGPPPVTIQCSEEI
jgi:tetratricopeptide (TPR) repeat protein/tRNA A-37 threonylcarbamoyl transferase component Bud32